MSHHHTAKSRGSAAERELVHRFLDRGWAAFRAPASGSMDTELPDVIAGNAARKVGVECKITKDGVKYLTKGEVDALVVFSTRFGCEPWIGVKFLRRGWRFLNPEDVRQTKVGSYAIRWEDAERKGLTFEELVG